MPPDRPALLANVPPAQVRYVHHRPPDRYPPDRNLQILTRQHEDALASGGQSLPRILAYMTRGPCAVAVWRGDGAVAKVRTLAGATRPDEADPRSLRGRYGVITPEGGIENVLHCSATPEEAEIEIARFFRPA